MKLSLYWSYATRSLRRGGQRTLLALFCVAVGVMAIIALQLVGLSVNQALVGNIVAANGGDIRLSASLDPLRPGDLKVLDTLKKQGHITDYATSDNPGGSITLSNGNEAVFSFLAVSANFPLVGQADMLLPGSNPTLPGILKGNQVVMSSSVFQQLGAHIGSTYRVKTLDGRLVPVTVAAEIAEEGFFRGPQVLIAQNTLAGIAGPTGKALPVQYDTAYLTVPASQLDFVRGQINQQLQGVRITTANDLLKQRQAQVDQIRLFLRIVGLLALFIGGIGIINTMQVLLRRRQVEIAMLKTTGYRRRDLYALFGLEAALLGLIGGILGAGLGLGASYLVRLVVERAFLIQLPIVLDPLTIVSGIFIGLATALIFGLLPIIQASQIRPLSVLRELAEERRISSRLLNSGLLLLLSILFVFLSASILGDLVTSIIAVYGGAILVFALAAGFGLLILAISRLPVYERMHPRVLLGLFSALGIVVLAGLLTAGLLLAGRAAERLATHLGNSSAGTYLLIVPGGLGIILFGGAIVYLLAALLNILVVAFPQSWKTAVMLAYRNLGRQRVRTATTLVALFVGVFAIGLILILGQGIKDTINSTLSTLFTHNVFIITSPRQANTINRQLANTAGIDMDKTEINAVVSRLYPILVAGQDINSILRNLTPQTKLSRGTILSNLDSIEGFELTAQGNQPDITITRGRNLQASDAGTLNILLNTQLQQSPLNLRPGDTIMLQSADGKVTRILTIVGFYDNSQLSSSPNFASILADSALAQQLGGATTLEIYSLKIDPQQVPTLRQHLNQSVPSAVLFSVTDIDALVNQLLDNLVIMLTSIASLAMIAGLIIIANAVALAMLERRREIGILKAVGHTSRSILAIVLIENGLVGLLGSLVSMLLVGGAVIALSRFVFQTDLAISPELIILVIAATTILTMLVALSVAWQSVRVRPLEVLRYE